MVTAMASGVSMPIIAVAVPNRIMFWDIIDEKAVGEYVFSEDKEIYCNSLTFVAGDMFLGLSTGVLMRCGLDTTQQVL